ncbi:MAG: DUF2142 domain-containing protein [Chloroflexi bacterium]|nr:DUF2142 domain-containing protein [Chloroflexota bacterium]
MFQPPRLSTAIRPFISCIIKGVHSQEKPLVERDHRLCAERRIALLLVLLCFIEGAVFAAVTPLWRAPDEPKYFQEIQLLAGKHHFQSITGHPPLYAVIQAVPYLLGRSVPEQVFLIRLAGAAMNAATVWLVYKITLLLFRKHRLAVFMPAALVALNPQFNFIGASINSDPLLTLISTAFFYVALRIMRSQLYLGNGMALLVVAALGMLAKQRFFVLLPILIPVIALGLYRRFRPMEPGAKGKRGLIGLATWAVALLALGVTPLIMKAVAPALGSGAFPSMSQVWSVIKLPTFLPTIFYEFWGYFDWLLLPMRRWAYFYFAALGGVGLAGLIIATWTRVVRLGLRKALLEWRLITWLVFGIALFFAVYAVAQYSVQMGGGAQGRYLFIIIAPMAILLGRGLAELVPARKASPVFAVVLITLLAVNYLEIVYQIMPYYY